ncbi:MAG: hypothetical protein ABIK54_06545, partial [candidate division WOR-3 bacterium]
MKKLSIQIVLLVGLIMAAQPVPPALDTLYFYYAERQPDRAWELLQRLHSRPLSRSHQLLLSLEIGDYFLDKVNDYSKAESVYQQLLQNYPRHQLTPAIIYRLAFAQELQEKYLDAAKNYELVATRYIKSSYAEDALDAIERCFRKNYQERVAYVNSYPITRIELDERISRNPSAYERFEAKLKLLDTMIDNRLLYEAALKAGVSNDPQIRKSLLDLRNRQMFQVWYDRHVTARAEPKENELRAYYRKNITRFTLPEKVHAFQLAVTSRALAESLRTVLITDTTKWD